MGRKYDETEHKACLSLEFDVLALETLYARYNRKEYIHPDPLEFLYQYEDTRDREIVGLLAACLAYGRVNQILKSVASVLRPMGPSPFDFVMGNSLDDFRGTFKQFKHRFTTGEQMASFLNGIRKVLRGYGSLQACFLFGMSDRDTTVLPALTMFVRELSACAEYNLEMFLPAPEKGSACKRLNLFLRWMVRCDAVDLGGWTGIDPASLIVPLDTHMHRIGRLLGLICRKQADMRSALEMTEHFRRLIPEDPVRYDFALTRLGIRDDLSFTVAGAAGGDYRKFSA